MKKTIFIILLVFILLINSMFVLSIFAKDTEEKIICNATLDDDFAEDCVLVTLKKAYSEINKKYTVDDFSEVACIEVKDLTYIPDYENKPLLNKDDFHQILSIGLKNKGKKEVLNAIKILEKREDVLSAEPNYYFEPEGGFAVESSATPVLPTAEPTVASSPSRDDLPNSQDDNSILWICIILGAAVVSLISFVIIKKKKVQN